MPLFDVLTEYQKEAVIAALVVHNFQDGRRIVKIGDPGNLLYIIKEGTVEVSHSG